MAKARGKLFLFHRQKDGAAARVTERGSRADDKASKAAMEDRKKAGYF